MATAKQFAAQQKKKQQRQKIFVIVGGVLLVVVFAYEAMTLGLLGGKKAPPTAVDTSASTTVASTAPNSLTPPALPGTVAPAASTATPSSGLVDTDVPPSTARDGQLVSFGVFQSKNPFAPQVHDSTSNAAGSASVVPASGGSGTTGTTGTTGSSGSTPTRTSGADVPPAGATVTPSTTGTTGTTPTGTSTTTTATVPAEVVSISVNGDVSKVGKDGTFPSGAPVFRLVSFGKGTAEIGIVGGSYQSGGATLTLQQGKAVTLMNTSDNKRYKLVLLSTP